MLWPTGSTRPWPGDRSMKRLRILPAVLALPWALACAKEDRALLQVEVHPGTVIDIASVTLTVESGGNVVKRRGYDWAAPAGQPRAVGLFLAPAAAGTMTVRAMATDGTGSVIACSSAESVGALVNGQVSELITLHLLKDACPERDGGTVDQRSSGGDGSSAGDGPAADRPSTDLGGAGGNGGDGGSPKSWRDPASIEEMGTGGTPSETPDVVMDPLTGNAVVVWSEPAAIRSRRYDAAANTWDDIKVITTTGMPRLPQVEIYNTNIGVEFVAVWLSDPNLPAAQRGIWW